MGRFGAPLSSLGAPRERLKALVPASSVEFLSCAIESLLIDRGLRERLGAAGRARVTERFNLNDKFKVLEPTFESCFHP